jgi:hypothetical protein
LWVFPDPATIPPIHSLEALPGEQETVVSEKTRQALESVLENVNSGRREALKRLLAGAGALALIPASAIVANAAQDDAKKGEGKKKGGGKKKGDPESDGKKGDGEAKKGEPSKKGDAPKKGDGTKKGDGAKKG